MYVCNPWPGMSYDQASGALQNAVADPTIRRRLIRLRQYGDHNEPKPRGTMDFLTCPPRRRGRVRDRCSRQRPTRCVLRAERRQFQVQYSDGGREAFSEIDI
jgi:hypothetical protein